MNTIQHPQRSRPRRFVKAALGLSLALVFLVGAAFVVYVAYPNHTIPAPEPVDRYVYLDQGWGSAADSPARETYYYTAQGTAIPQGSAQHPLRYSWFVHLEMPLGTDRFADPEHLRSYRFIVDPQRTKANPDQLPVGFAKHFSTALADDVLDITCAACHTGQLHYEKDGTRYALRVDGGQAMHAFTDTARGGFGTTLLASLTATYVNPAKFRRFAKNVLGDRYEAEKDRLHDELGGTLKALVSVGQNNPLRHLYRTREGYGRTDALGRIANTVFGDHLVVDNYAVGAAPVSYPYVWNIWKFDWVQYNGSVSQPLARNIGEALGVGAIIDLVDGHGNAIPAAERFNSSVRIPALVEIEQTLQTLKPPRWPSTIFGAPDLQLAAQGEALFTQHCQSCHGPHTADPLMQAALAPGKPAPGQEWNIEVIPVAHIGTDPAAANAFVERRYDLSATGLTNAEVRAALRPIRLRQLVRDMRYHLLSLIQGEAQPGRLAALAGRLPADGPEPQIDPGALAAIDVELTEQFGAMSELSAQQPPHANNDCGRECHARSLLWHSRYGLQAIESTLAGVDVRRVTEGEGLNIIGIFIKNKYYADNRIGFDQQQCLEGFGTLDLPQQIAGYKPRPLEGVWATPPFLHNGSVPSIYQLLSPPEQRQDTFVVGTRDYDPKHLGYVSTEPADASGFVFDTSIDGNHNGGHAFAASAQQWQRFTQDPKRHPLPPGVIGPELSEQARLALLEYLKVHRDEPGAPAELTPTNCFAVQSAAR